MLGLGPNRGGIYPRTLAREGQFTLAPCQGTSITKGLRISRASSTSTAASHDKGCLQHRRPMFRDSCESSLILHTSQISKYIHKLFKIKFYISIIMTNPKQKLNYYRKLQLEQINIYKTTLTPIEQERLAWHLGKKY